MGKAELIRNSLRLPPYFGLLDAPDVTKFPNAGIFILVRHVASTPSYSSNSLTILFRPAQIKSLTRLRRAPNGSIPPIGRNDHSIIGHNPPFSGCSDNGLTPFSYTNGQFSRFYGNDPGGIPRAGFFPDLFHPRSSAIGDRNIFRRATDT